MGHEVLRNGHRSSPTGAELGHGDPVDPDSDGIVLVGSGARVGDGTRVAPGQRVSR